LGMLMTGTLQQLDASTGVAPQNNGLFASRTVEQMLFGYTNQLGGVVIPPITLGYVRPTTAAGMVALMAKDALLYNQGRISSRVMGMKDVDRTGQWITYEGAASYATNCELIDPALAYACSTSVGRAATDWVIYPSPGETIAGSSDALHSPPLREGDANILPSLEFYVPELQRRVPALYIAPSTVAQDIVTRRYCIDPALVVTGTSNNPWKNADQWKQADVPDGLVSLQALNGGVPAIASQPYFGRASPSSSPTNIFSHIACSRDNGHTYVSCGDYQPDLHDTCLVGGNTHCALASSVSLIRSRPL
jgi:hypothetical protein